jgi:hypothetical protein
LDNGGEKEPAMKNRIIAIVTLGSFLVFSWSCFSIREIKPEVLANSKGKI